MSSSKIRRKSVFLIRHLDARTLVEFCWLGVVAFVPLVFNPAGAYVFEPVKVSLFRSLVITGFLIVVLSWGRRGAKQHSIGTNLTHFLHYPLAVPIFVNAGTYALATIFSVDLSMSFWGRCSKMHGAFTGLSYVGIWVVIVGYLRKREQIQRIFKTICLTSSLVATYAVMQKLHLDPIPWQNNFGKRVFSTLAHPNALGTYMAMTIPITIALALESYSQASSQRVHCVFFTITLLPQAVALIGSGSRAGMAGTAIALLLFALVGSVYLCRTCPQLRVVLAVTLLVSVLVFAGLVFENVDVSAFLGTRPNTVVSRLLIWQASLDLAFQHPVLGFGPAGFGFAFQSVYPPALAHYEGYGVTPDRAHNILLDTLVMNGSLGLISLLALWIVFFIKGVAGIRQSKTFPWYLATILSTFGAYVTHAMFSFDLVELGSLLWVLIGIMSVLLAKQDRIVEPRVCQYSNKRIIWREGKRWVLQSIAIGVALCSILFGNIRFNLANTWRGFGRRAAAAGFFHRSANFHSKSAVLCPECVEDLDYLAGLLLKEYHITGDLTLLKEAKNVLYSAINLRPYDSYQHANLGHLNLQWGKVDPSKLRQATNAYHQAMNCGSSYPQYHMYLGLAYRVSGDSDAAELALERALALDPLYVPAHVQLGMLRLERDDDSLAVSHFQSAIDAYSTWSEINAGIISAGTFDQELTTAYTALIQVSYERKELTKALHYSHQLAELNSTSRVENENQHVLQALEIRPRMP